MVSKAWRDLACHYLPITIPLGIKMVLIFSSHFQSNLRPDLDFPWKNKPMHNVEQTISDTAQGPTQRKRAALRGEQV